jgi:hypothetical protein
MATASSKAARNKPAVGHASLTEDERQLLKWSPAFRLAQFQKVNEGTDREVLENKLLYIDSIAIDGGEILDAMRVNPKLTWEVVKDLFLGDPVDGYTSTFHHLGDINYPEHFWKAIIENERQKLL